MRSSGQRSLLNGLKATAAALSVAACSTTVPGVPGQNPANPNTGAQGAAQSATPQQASKDEKPDPCASALSVASNGLIDKDTGRHAETATNLGSFAKNWTIPPGIAAVTNLVETAVGAVVIATKEGDIGGAAKRFATGIPGIAGGLLGGGIADAIQGGSNQLLKSVGVSAQHMEGSNTENMIVGVPNDVACSSAPDPASPQTASPPEAPPAAPSAAPADNFQVQMTTRNNVRVSAVQQRASFRTYKMQPS